MKRIQLVLFIGTICISLLYAQLSPGELQKSHANLEGIENCTKCHVQGKQISSSNCLNCHTLLKEQIEKNAGLHSASEYSECGECHMDHVGRNFEMIYWGKVGKESFDHSKTGYSLEAAHAKLACEKCHRESKILNTSKLKQKGKDLNRTYLGLGKQCLNCHTDEHREQMDNNCLSCHNMNKWENATGFDHAKTRFKLTGKHLTVKCESCHKTIQDDKYPEDKTYLNFNVQKFNACQDCHQDIHKGRFGSNCTKCHNTSGWQNYNANNFDHNNTLYPLRGLHSTVQCAQCHKPGKPMKITKYQECRDCHSDIHKGQFANRAMKGVCEECHNVQGFSPSQYSLDMHQLSAYPLEASHLAVPCLECHKKNKSSVNSKNVLSFRFTTTQCESCHKDVHQGNTANFSGDGGCKTCHSVIAWNKITFDHTKTKFTLQGAHKQTACIKCHKNEMSAGSQTWQFQNIIMDCFNCHNDIHNGQFNTPGKQADCNHCHTPVDWFAARFNHEKDARFSLKGAHEYVPCQKCHFNKEDKGKPITIYKPLEAKCESCHTK